MQYVAIIPVFIISRLPLKLKMNEDIINDDNQVLIRELQRDYLDFLDDEQESGKYYERTKAMIEDKDRRIIINVNDLRKKNPNRCRGLLNNCFIELAAFQRAVKEYVANIDPAYAKEYEDFFIGFEGNFGSKHVTPRTLTSQFLGNLICVEGIVSKCSFSKLKIVRSVHYCPTTGKFLERKYTDLTSTEAYPSSAVYPTKDEDGNLLETEYGLSCYKDHQTLTIQEMPEKAPAGQLPRSVDVICDNDLVDAAKPGDRIRVIGCYRCLPGKHGGFTSGIFRTVVIANSISLITSTSNLILSRDDMNRFKKLSRRKDIFELLSKSLAPSIHGHDYVKKAVLCLLLGGAEKVLPNGTRLRGDINVLLVGDPGVAKSQMLRFVLQTAPRAIPTTGRGSSGVGLTAAVTTDPETNERRLEAGAMVLADRGVVCIDEFDKMSDIDRTAIHEVMEQGKVTISKAGIHARLNARCSVLAAANPVYGKYDQYKTPMENIGLQDSLLSRFDLLFVLLDIVDTEDDKRISDHVVRMHRYRNPNEQDGEVLSMNTGADLIYTSNDTGKNNENDMFEKYNPLLHGKNRSKKDQILTINFIKKYIIMCKSMKPPILSEEASQLISEEYSRLRSQDTLSSDVARTQPITARTLETLIRLSTARAKARFSKTVDAEDAATAIELVQYAIFRKVLDKRDRKKRSRNEDEEEMDVDDDEDNEIRDQRSKRLRSTQEADEFERLTSQEEQPTPSLAELREQSRITREKGGTSQTTQIDVSNEKLKVFKDTISKIFVATREQSLPMHEVMSYLNSQPEPMAKEEIDACFQILSDQNLLMISDNTVYLI
ncbi:DNA replication licensing factor MCM3, putative [Pediculus humanus corporis]|uniref:DNA replication licensing factor MCM3 n=1 Tax=Pediculus humanus subsp. corporis TaxID=121224 RepID=E0VX66_PEDHC|nr:DNA replication licensing factor MCM3, putative [Pediculus humanus corporis]EEB17972.1 DNA replication licensing factor MCM3, putative [Pediculus humanus corporis]